MKSMPVDPTSGPRWTLMSRHFAEHSGLVVLSGPVLADGEMTTVVPETEVKRLRERMRLAREDMDRGHHATAYAHLRDA